MIAYVSNVDSNNFEEFSKQEGLVVIDIWAEWCMPCKVLSPIVDTVAAEFTQEKLDVKVGKMDVDKNKDLAAELGVTSIPTILIYKDGEVIHKNVGMIQKAKLKQLIQEKISNV